MSALMMQQMEISKRMGREKKMWHWNVTKRGEEIDMYII